MHNLVQIQCFLKVAELKSFTHAARELFITPTAVSKQIKNLEEQLSQQLFIRNPRKVELTAFAKALYLRYKSLDAQLESINQFIAAEKEEPQGNLNVLVSTHLCKQFVLRQLKTYMERYPKVKIELIFAEDDRELQHKDIDIMVGFAWVSSDAKQWQSKKLFDIGNILCASPNFVKKYGKPEQAKDLINYPLISHSLRKPAETIPLANDKQIPCATPILLMNDFDALCQACLDGIGILLTGDLMIKPWLDKGELVPLLTQYDYKQYEIFLFYRLYEYELLKIKSFVEFYCE